MRKTISIVAATVIVAAGIAAWATGILPANSAAMGVQSQAVISVDTLDLMKQAKDLPVEHVDNPI